MIQYARDKESVLGVMLGVIMLGVMHHAGGQVLQYYIFEMFGVTHLHSLWEWGQWKWENGVEWGQNGVRHK